MPGSYANYLRPACELGKIKLRQNFDLRGWQNSHSSYPPMKRLAASFQLWQHSAADDRSCHQSGYVSGVQPGNDGSLRVLHTFHVSQENQTIGMAGDGAR